MPVHSPRLRSRIAIGQLVSKQLIPSSVRSSDWYRSARNYAKHNDATRLGRAPITKPGWFIQVREKVLRAERDAFSRFHSSDFIQQLNKLPPEAKEEVKRRYRELRSISSRMRRIGNMSMTRHERTYESYNRNYFDERVNDALARPNNKPFAVAMIDFDHFGPVNKIFGKKAGDLVLDRFTELLKKELMRVGGFHGRVWGEEFEVYAPISPKRLKLFLDNFRKAFLRHTRSRDFLNEVSAIKISAGEMENWVPISFSAGVTGVERHVSPIKKIGRLFSIMDEAMQRVKQQGRGKTQIVPLPRAA